MEIDASRLSPKASAILHLRGSALPPLQWHGQGHATARATLDDLDDTQLFAPHNVQDAGQASAVRGLLYLWHRFAEEAPLVAVDAPEKDRHYLSSLCFRHRGMAEKAKEELHHVQEHEVYSQIVPKVLETMGLGVDPAIKRVADIIRMNGEWEPYAFIDLYEQARDGQLSSASEETVRTIQQYEFMMLLRHCYQQATGVDIARGSIASTPAPTQQLLGDDSTDAGACAAAYTHSEPAWKRNLEAQRRAKKADIPYSQQSAAPKSNKKDKKNKGDNDSGDRKGKAGRDEMTREEPKKQAPPVEQPKREYIRVLCPQCKKMLTYDPSAAGKRVQCTGCSKVFTLASNKQSAA